MNATRFLRSNSAVFLLLALVCVAEAWLHRNQEILLISGVNASTLRTVETYYVHGYTYDNDLDNDPLHIEAYNLARVAYMMAGRYVYNGYYDIYLGYPPDKYRLLLPFLASFFLGIFKLKTAYLIVNTLMWSLAAFSVYWLGYHFFRSKRIGLVAGLLYATSYAFIAVSSSPKAELMQLAAPLILTGLSFFLHHYANDISMRSLADSFLLGAFAGIGLYAGGGSPYFIAFMLLYGILSMRFLFFLRRSLVFFGGLLLVNALVSIFVRQYTEMSVAGMIQTQISSLDIGFILACTWRRFVEHFIFIIPVPQWIGMVVGLYRLPRRLVKPLICMGSSLVVSEAIMTAAQGTSCYAWTINYYYLQVLLPIYLLTARGIIILIFGINEDENDAGGKAVPLRKNVTPFWTAIRRTAGIALILIILFVSNLALLGNKYYYYAGFRPTPLETLYHGFWSVDNLGVYKGNVH